MLMVIFKNYPSVAIYNSLVTIWLWLVIHQLISQSPCDSLGECPVVVDHTIIFGWMLGLCNTIIYYKASFYPCPKC